MGLFIGIGEYEHPEFAPTHEQLSHSAEVMHQLMVERGGLTADTSKLLLDKQATKSNIHKVFNNLTFSRINIKFIL